MGDQISQPAGITIEVVYCSHFQGLPKPDYQTEGAAGIDLLAAIDQDIILPGGEIRLVPTGICLAIPPGFEGQVRPRSGLALKHGVTLLNSPGTIDSDYRGEIKVIMINHSREDFRIQRGMRIAQLLISAFVRAELQERTAIGSTARNEGGFGHTGL